jgi:hypothetical protein
MTHAAQLTPVLVDALYRPRRRPLVLRGRSRSGKTSILREAARRAGRQTVRYSAFDLAGEVVEAIRGDTYESYRAALVADPRPLCIEHLEDLRGKPSTRDVLRRLLQQAAGRRPVLLTLTRAERDGEIVRWLRPWAQLLSLD